MNWEQNVELEAGSPWSTSTDLCDLTVKFDGGKITYTRPDFENPDSGEEIVQHFVLESITDSDAITFDFTPIYPDRPIVFKIEDQLKIPPGENGFFCVNFRIAVGVTLHSGTIVERLLPAKRKKSCWGPPNNGVPCYRELTNFYTDTQSVMTETYTTTATVPIYYLNRRVEGDEVDYCIVPLNELDLYRNEQDDLIFEVVRLRHEDEHYQEPRPLKRPPKEMKQHVDHFMHGPAEAQSLFAKIQSLPRLTDLNFNFLNR